ncbi:MAG: histidine kinase dimerization/phospho-acceptor domain-containing protein [Pseudomonadota bacterium]
MINNNIFLLSTMTIAIMCTHFTSQARKREFKTLIDLQEARDKLRHLDTLKSEFFSKISHELRTPLTNIILPVQKVLEEMGHKISSNNVEEKRGMLRNAHKLLKRINEILDISKLEAGKMKLKTRLGI